MRSAQITAPDLLTVTIQRVSEVVNHRLDYGKLFMHFETRHIIKDFCHEARKALCEPEAFDRE